MESGAVVLAAGAWSVPIAESAGLDLPIRPARWVALFERPYALPTHLTLIDTTEGLREARRRADHPRRQPGQPGVAG